MNKTIKNIGPYFVCPILFIIFLIGLEYQSSLENKNRFAKAATDSIRSLEHYLKLFNADCGRYPTQEEGLNALLLDPELPGWRGPYLTGEVNNFEDPWGTPYRFLAIKNEIKVQSAGPDKIFDTKDDL